MLVFRKFFHKHSMVDPIGRFRKKLEDTDISTYIKRMYLRVAAQIISEKFPTRPLEELSYETPVNNCKQLVFVNPMPILYQIFSWDWVLCFP